MQQILFRDCTSLIWNPQKMLSLYWNPKLGCKSWVQWKIVALWNAKYKIQASTCNYHSDT